MHTHKCVQLSGMHKTYRMLKCLGDFLDFSKLVIWYLLLSTMDSRFCELHKEKKKETIDTVIFSDFITCLLLYCYVLLSNKILLTC